MEERKYKVMDDMGFCLATNMSLEMALLFMKAYCQEYYNERIKLRLELIVREDTECCPEPMEDGEGSVKFYCG